MKRLLPVVLLASLVCAPAMAHHSRAAFALNETIPMKVKITRVRWSNPHVFWAGTVVNDKGVAEEWTFEGHSISGLVRQGWTANTLKVGDEVQFFVNPHKDRTKHFALVDRVVFADGRVLYSVGVPPQNAVASRPKIEPSKDFSGNWRYKFPGTAEEVRKRVLLGAGGPDLNLPYTAKGKAQAVAWNANDNPQLSCGPISLPALIMTVYEYKWIRHPDRIEIQKEQYIDADRVIWLNRTKPPADYKPDPLGFSVGRFEPDGTLVVETTGFSPVKWGNAPGVDSGPRKRIVERYKLIDGGMAMSVSYTLEDPDYFTAPVTGQGTYTKSADSEFAKQPPCDLSAAREHLNYE
ncbi:MAG: hypothetical protein IRZ28_03990 [Steroidobacteraceae bacterium]|nr:hypothetical protein [Steroidobacteraceae bacterium]